MHFRKTLFLTAAALLSVSFPFEAFLSSAAPAAVYYPESEEAETEEPGFALSELAVRTDNSDEAPVLSGGEIRFLANTASSRQQLCGVFKSSDGKVLVVDGGVSENAPHLLSVLKEYGGRVDAWLITHPQDDHVGALNEILRNHPKEVDIQNIYFHFNSPEWYKSVAPEDVPMIEALTEALKTLPPGRLHGFSGNTTQDSSADSAAKETSEETSEAASEAASETTSETTSGSAAGGSAENQDSSSRAKSASAPSIIYSSKNKKKKNPYSPIAKGQTVTLSGRLSFRILNDPLQIPGSYAVNNSSIMYDIEIDGKHVIVLGDMGPDGGDRLLPEIRAIRLKTDFVVMAHHGQNGVRENFYLALNPKACIWSSPDWLFDASPKNQKLRTSETKSWVNAMGITKNYCTKDGDVVIR